VGILAEREEFEEFNVNIIRALKLVTNFARDLKLSFLADHDSTASAESDAIDRNRDSSPLLIGARMGAASLIVSVSFSKFCRSQKRADGFDPTCPQRKSRISNRG